MAMSQNSNLDSQWSGKYKSRPTRSCTLRKPDQSGDDDDDDDMRDASVTDDGYNDDNDDTNADTNAESDVITDNDNDFEVMPYHRTRCFCRKCSVMDDVCRICDDFGAATPDIVCAYQKCPAAYHLDCLKKEFKLNKLRTCKDLGNEEEYPCGWRQTRRFRFMDRSEMGRDINGEECKKYRSIQWKTQQYHVGDTVFVATSGNNDADEERNLEVGKILNIIQNENGEAHIIVSWYWIKSLYDRDLKPLLSGKANTKPKLHRKEVIMDNKDYKDEVDVSSLSGRVKIIHTHNEIEFKKMRRKWKMSCRAYHKVEKECFSDEENSGAESETVVSSDNPSDDDFDDTNWSEPTPPLPTHTAERYSNKIGVWYKHLKQPPPHPEFFAHSANKKLGARSNRTKLHWYKDILWCRRRVNSQAQKPSIKPLTKSQCEAPSPAKKRKGDESLPMTTPPTKKKRGRKRKLDYIVPPNIWRDGSHSTSPLKRKLFPKAGEPSSKRRRLESGAESSDSPPVHTRRRNSIVPVTFTNGTLNGTVEKKRKNTAPINPFPDNVSQSPVDSDTSVPPQPPSKKIEINLLDEDTDTDENPPIQPRLSGVSNTAHENATYIAGDGGRLSVICSNTRPIPLPIVSTSHPHPTPSGMATMNHGSSITPESDAIIVTKITNRWAFNNRMHAEQIMHVHKPEPRLATEMNADVNMPPLENDPSLRKKKSIPDSTPESSTVTEVPLVVATLAFDESNAKDDDTTDESVIVISSDNTTAVTTPNNESNDAPTDAPTDGMAVDGFDINELNPGCDYIGYLERCFGSLTTLMTDHTDVAIDVLHRITTDVNRLSKTSEESSSPEISVRR